LGVRKSSRRFLQINYASEKVDEMIEFCHEGPPAAIVKNVEVKWEDPTGKFDDFDIVF